MAFIKKEVLIPYLEDYKKLIEDQKRSEFERSFTDINEEYKRDIPSKAQESLKVDTWNEQDVGHGTIGKNAIKAVQRNQNLIGKYQVSAFTNKVTEDVEESERVLFDLYHDKKEQECFEKLCKLFGKKYDLISYLYFIIDPNRYLPLRSSIFDDIFKKLEIDFQLSGRCSWENYQEFLSIVAEIRDYMREYYQHDDIDLTEAHSFLWEFNPNGALAKEEKTDDESIKIGTVVKHNFYGEGTVTRISDEKIYVGFTIGQRIFTYPDAFAKNYLTKLS